MDTERAIGKAPRTREIGAEVMGLRGGCVGCAGCKGLCNALIEAITLPRAILGREDRP